MKKLSKFFAVTFGVMVITASAVMAETTKFTPLNFSDGTAVRSTSTSVISDIDQKSTDLLDPSQVKGGTKMQNSILQMDNAQVEIRNNLLNYKTKYAEIDARYEAAKAERKAAKKQIKNAEKQIKNLDKAKKQIRKNFERKINM